MCHHHRSRCGYGHHGYSYGYPHHRSGGPLTALVALAAPLLTQHTGDRQTLAQEPSQAYQDPPTTRLAPQTSGHTVAAREAPLPPTASPRDPPPAYDDRDGAKSSRAPQDGLEKDLADMYISERTPPAAAAAAAVPASNTYSGVVGARDYQPLLSREAQQAQPTTTTTARGIVIASSILDPSSRWAARLQRKEAKVHAKLARKAEKYARRERRDLERGC